LRDSPNNALSRHLSDRAVGKQLGIADSINGHARVRRNRETRTCACPRCRTAASTPPPSLGSPGEGELRQREGILGRRSPSGTRRITKVELRPGMMYSLARRILVRGRRRGRSNRVVLQAEAGHPGTPKLGDLRLPGVGRRSTRAAGSQTRMPPVNPDRSPPLHAPGRNRHPRRKIPRWWCGTCGHRPRTSSGRHSP